MLKKMTCPREVLISSAISFWMNKDLIWFRDLKWKMTRSFIKFFLFVGSYHIAFPVSYGHVDVVVEILLLLSTLEVSE